MDLWLPELFRDGLGRDDELMARLGYRCPGCANVINKVKAVPRGEFIYREERE